MDMTKPGTRENPLTPHLGPGVEYMLHAYPASEIPPLGRTISLMGNPYLAISYSPERRELLLTEPLTRKQLRVLGRALLPNGAEAKIFAKSYQVPIARLLERKYLLVRVQDEKIVYHTTWAGERVLALTAWDQGGLGISWPQG